MAIDEFDQFHKIINDQSQQQITKYKLKVKTIA